MRGYGETDRPPNKMDYTFDKLKQDIVELIPALGYSKCTLVSHDWGGVVAWCVPGCQFLIGSLSTIQKEYRCRLFGLNSRMAGLGALRRLAT